MSHRFPLFMVPAMRPLTTWYVTAPYGDASLCCRFFYCDIVHEITRIYKIHFPYYYTLYKWSLYKLKITLYIFMNHLYLNTSMDVE